MWWLILANWKRIVAAIIALIIFIILAVEGAKRGNDSGWRLGVLLTLSLMASVFVYLGTKRGLNYMTQPKESTGPAVGEPGYAPAGPGGEPRALPSSALAIPPPTNVEARGAAEMPIVLPPPPTQ